MTFSSGKRGIFSSSAYLPVALALAAISTATAVHATTYSEAVSGDLSGDAKNPTKIGNLTPGSNLIVGATIPSGPIVNPITGQHAVEDDDYVSFTIPAGHVLSQLFLGSGSVFQPGDRMFFGIAQGAQVNVDPNFSSAAGLLGWTLVGSSMVGSDVLPALGLSAPANFPPIGGATRFTGALGAGTYTLWLVDGDQPASYSLNLVVAAVPDSATWMMMLTGFAAVGHVLRRRRKVMTRVAFA